MKQCKWELDDWVESLDRCSVSILARDKKPTAATDGTTMVRMKGRHPLSAAYSL